MENDIKKAARSAWAYRNFDFLAAVLISAKLFAVGVWYSGHVEAGFDMGYWFWLSIVIQILPIIVLLGILKAFVRRAVLHYEVKGNIRVTKYGLVEAGVFESVSTATYLGSSLAGWLSLLRISVWVFSVFYVSIRVVFAAQFAQISIWIPDLAVAAAFVASVAMTVRHKSVSYT